jgi:CubicO group peptidase (beta-lactamase class C family)
MGLKSIVFNPYLKYDLKDIVPTEDDKIFRKRLIHGYVHDQGAAMLGGVAGHAGIFANATDLAGLFQLFLNEGNYGGVQYVQPNVIKEYTKVQFAGNRRGAGFDKPKLNVGGGTCHTLASPESYGHSGFTGTVAWADPRNQINYVFLSNRVYPDAENWKIVNMNIRTDIQKVIYKAVSDAKK